jgi:hypothetical protein
MAKSRHPWRHWFEGAEKDKCERSMETGKVIEPKGGAAEARPEESGTAPPPSTFTQTLYPLPGNVTFIEPPPEPTVDERRRNLVKRLASAPPECEFALVEILAVPNRPGVFGVGVFATVGEDYQTDLEWANKALAYGMKATGKLRVVEEWNDVRNFDTVGNC